MPATSADGQVAGGNPPGRLRQAILVAVVGLLVLHTIGAVRGTWYWVKPFDRFAGRPWPERANDPYKVLGGRYSQLKEPLRGVEAAGFVCGFPSWEIITHRMMAQYVLVPTVVTTDAEPLLVIGSFPNEMQLDEFLAGQASGPGRLVVRRRFGEGLALLEHTSE
jgi:hypothetical protein